MDNQTEKKHFKSFWPIVVIVLLSFFTGGAVMWIVYNFNLQESLNSILPSYNARIHKKIEQENAEKFNLQVEENQIQNKKDGMLSK